MSCGCSKIIRGKIISNKKTDLNWTIDRAKQISILREQDVQIYIKEETKDYTLYEIELPLNPSRDKIVKIIRFKE